MIETIPPYFLVSNPLYEKNGTPFTPIPICPTGVGVFVLFVDGTNGILFKYRWFPISGAVEAKGPILCDGIPVLATIASVVDL